MTATVPTAADLLRTLSPEVKEELLSGLLRELMQMQGALGEIPLHTETGEFIGCFMPPAAVHARNEELLAQMPPKVREAMTRPLPPDFDPDDSYTAEELDDLSRQRNQKSR
jgi:hypothetical protein